MSRQALWPMAHASQLLPIPVGPQIARLSYASIHSPLQQRFEQPTLETAGPSVVDIFRCGLVPQFGVSKARAEPLVVLPGGFPVEQQGQPLGMPERGGVTMPVEFGKGFDHALQAKRLQLVKGRDVSA